MSILEKTYCRLVSFSIEGVGVVAIQDIPKGMCPFPNMSQRVLYEFHMDELAHLPQEVVQMIDDYFVIEKNGTVKIYDSVFTMDFSFFVNHSSEPNLQTIDDGFTFVATRDIPKGEELTVDYGSYDEKWHRGK